MSSSQTINFWQGNQACAEAAIAAGCRFFAGYPITPASEIAEIMSRRLPEVGGRYMQMEDEIAAISAVIGSSWGGMLSMTATSGPGFSLMQENIGYAAMTETPCVVVDVQRAGPSTGQATKGAQGDFMQSRWGTHGDYEAIVLAPNSAQETFELTVRAFHLSERLRHPVILLSDEIVAHSRERVILDTKEQLLVEREFAKSGELPYGEVDSEGHAKMPRFGDGHNLLVTGSTHDELGFRRTSDAETHDKLVRRISSKIRDASSQLADVVTNGPSEAAWGVVSFGSTSRAVEEVVLNQERSDVSSMRLRTLWPFPDDLVRAFAETVSKIIVPELNLGQLSREVSRVVDDRTEVVPFNKVGGGRMVEPDEILELMKESS
ncbi:2-oxoacid:acceptor oxidoreductase subunit alpha [Candidatus Thorarchaeota archaeon]|nr:MAG: 2-oxoacid:acceptor oxidoreductase subunit alpha [Candidatus Thorarchaeota archaeon]